MSHKARAFVVACAYSACTVGLALADTPISSFGMPGAIDLPVATPLEDGLLATTFSYTSGSLRSTLSFQLSPRITGSFRYSVLDGLLGEDRTLYDRSFDIQYLILTETDRRPALAVGLRDFGGTGVYGSEYFVASKTFGDKLSLSAGLGFGRLARHGGFSNPLGVISDYFDERPTGSTGIDQTGRLDAEQWFRGDAALFGSAAYRFNDRLSLSVEYSSDDYAAEQAENGFEYKTPINVGLAYRLKNGTQLNGYLLHGAEIGLSASFALHPDRPQFPGGRAPAPAPILPDAAQAALSWGTDTVSVSASESALASQLSGLGIDLVGLSVEGDHAQIRVQNTRYGAMSQATGRTARTLANTLPGTVRTFDIILDEKGIPISKVTVRRRDLARLEHDIDGAWQAFGRHEISDAADDRTPKFVDAYPKLTFELLPYFQPSLFDPDSPIRADFGAQANVAYTPTPGLIFSGTFRQPLVGNLDDITRESNSAIQRVRSDSGRYAIESDFEISHLTAEYFFRPSTSLYGRLTAGYLEQMYAGVSGELLWYPVDSRFALGAELNYAKQRDFDQLFGLQDYDVVTGHASAYLDFGNGYLGQVDVGRYLAGDYGATFTFDREFSNGFRVGAFFTLTDVSFDDFGEGSFDKGIRLTLPLDWLTGEPSRDRYSTTIRPVLRDGGARLDVRNRLYGVTRDAHTLEMRDRWGRYWR